MVIDSHQHFWKYDPETHAWIDDNMQVIRRDFLPPDLHPHLDEYSIDGCVAVQADQSEVETRFLLELAENYPFIKAVVGWIDLWSDNLEDRLDHFSGYQKLSGFRHILQAEEPERMLEPVFYRGMDALQKYGYAYDILIYPKHLDAALKLVQTFPDQKFVIDHLAKPHIKDQIYEPWKSKMQEISEFGNVWCKISGMVTEAHWNNWKPDDLHPYMDFIFGIFGTKRLLFGSDWPVCLLAASYGDVWSVVKNYLEGFSEDEQGDVLGRNAAEFYGFPQND
jgi:L-fuconolactonase